jgi:primosomal protein N' (replication factor Y)
MTKYQTNTLFAEKEPPEQDCSHIVRVVFESAVDTEFSYLVPDKLWPVEPGQRVEVPFGRKNKLQIGFCTGTDISRRETQSKKGKIFKLKKISRVVDKKALLDSELMELARWISSYYVCPLGQVLAAMVPAAVKKDAGVKKLKIIYLSDDFQQATEQIRGGRQKQIVAVLQKQKAFNKKDAVQLQALLNQLGCTNAPVKRLAQRQIVKIDYKTILKSLPAIPDEMTIKSQGIALNADQQKALAHITEQIGNANFGVTVLHGVTDSGKTELYIRAIEQTIAKGRAAIVLLPEIALTAQTVQRFSLRFERIAVMHSALTAAQRNVQWQKIRSGDADIVIGARSAVFAPLSRLGLIVVDEEHEPSYKQDTVPRYNGRDVAVKRAQLASSHCILGSATPSLETLLNTKSKKHFTLVSLPKRVMDFAFPQMKLVDMKRQSVSQNKIELISPPLEESLQQTLAKKQQAILLLNRRGYSNFVFCSSCKHTLHCRNCDVTLTFHKSSKSKPVPMNTITGRHIERGYAVCHYCGAKTLVRQNCPMCGKTMVMIGIGSQRLEEQLYKKFPNARIARIDSDSMQKRDYYRLLKDFGQGRIDILAGTQMLAKGLHFPNVTLVGIISADTALYLPDFRANERTFQLISQVAGRTGRSEKKGIVFVQTFLANQPAIQFALKNDFQGFVKEELMHRKACNLPPYWRLAIVLLRDANWEKLQTACKAMRQKLDEIVQRNNLSVTIRGPMPAVISRLQRYHRMQIIVQAPGPAVIQRLFDALRADTPVRPAVKVAIDIDPVNLL